LHGARGKRAGCAADLYGCDVSRRALVVTLLCACASAQVAPPPAPRRIVLPPPPPVSLVPVERCGETADGFDGWIASFCEHAIAEGISREVIAGALGTVEYDPSVIALDRSQRPQKLSFEEFSSTHVTAARVRRGKHLLSAHAALLAEITRRFGVAPEIVVAIWGLETDFGDNLGSTPSLRALATLAYDCRRSALFRGELSSALRILQRGDLSASAMVGAWAGELGQTQFLPSSYERFGIDFDADGRVDLVGSVEDVLASTANYLAGHGWRAGDGYRPGSPNFDVLAEWNKSDVYRRTIVLFASKLK
jgi:membrane-bound lytic murein transglycosylase B